MKLKRYCSVAVSALLLIAMSCRKNSIGTTSIGTKLNVKSVAVAPDLGVYDYASPGDTLEFKALDPKTQPFYVILDPSPCNEKCLTVKKDMPGSCKVQSGFNFYRYILTFEKPLACSPSPLPPPPPPPGKVFSLPKSCPQCQILIIRNPIGPVGPSPTESTPASPKATATASNVSYTSSGIGIPVTCNSGTVSVGMAEQVKGGAIFWANPENLLADLTITMPAGVCKVTGGSTNVFKQLKSCTLDAAPSSTPYTYNVEMSGCNKRGTGKLTILDPNTPK